MVANLFGDFVKGKDYSYLPPVVQEGVFLHRQIDDYIDHHPLVTQLRLHLFTELPKIAGIAIDLYFDHLLAKHWSLYHQKTLENFISLFLIHIEDKNNLTFVNPPFHYPPHFQKLLFHIKQHNLLLRNLHLENIKKTAEGLSKIISFDNNLNTAAEVFLNNEEIIETTFQEFMKDALIRFKP